MLRTLRIRLFGALILISLFVSFSQMDVIASFESTAGSAFLMESSSGKIFYEKNADVSVPPASITKIMTLLIGFEAIDKGKAKWDDLIPISEKAWRMEGSKMFLEVGKQVKYSDVITGISVVSANDGCIALAEFLYGSERAFVEVMNSKAKELGLTKSSFKNSTGLPEEGHYMSAKDIGMLAKYLIEKYPSILEIESKKEFTYNNIRQFNRNPLLGVFQGADGLKTGWTTEAGYCLVGTAMQDEMRLISVVLNTLNEEQRLVASTELLTYGFKNFKRFKLKSADEIVGTSNVKKGRDQTVELKIKEDIEIILPLLSGGAKDVKYVIRQNNEYVEAPIMKDTVVGKMEVQLNGEILKELDVYTSTDVPKEGLFKRLIKFIAGLFSFMQFYTFFI